MTLPNYDDLDDWKKAVKKHAKRIRGLISNQVFGRAIGDNRDALIVAVFLAGVKEGRENSEKILAEIIKKYENSEYIQ